MEIRFLFSLLLILLGCDQVFGTICFWISRWAILNRYFHLASILIKFGYDLYFLICLNGKRFAWFEEMRITRAKNLDVNIILGW